MPELRVIKLFVASPGDVTQERKRLEVKVKDDPAAPATPTTSLSGLSAVH